QALGNKIAVQESPWDCLNFVSMHHDKKPFDDKRVRRALSLALDRYEGSAALSKITLVKDVAGIQVPGTPYATPPAELEKLAGFIVEPDLDLPRFISTSDANYGRHKDTVIDDLMHRQGRATDLEERKKILRQLEKRLLDEEAHVIYTLQWHRIIPHLAQVKGWTITPSHYLNNQLDAVWLSE